MIDILNSSKSLLGSSSINVSAKMQSNPRNDKFGEVLDRSLSEQKQLSHELKQEKQIAKHKADLKDVQKTLEQLQKKIAKNPSETTEETQENVSLLEDLISFMENTLQSEEGFDEVEEMMPILSELLTQTVSFLENEEEIDPRIGDLLNQVIFVIDQEKNLQAMNDSPIKLEAMNNLVHNIQDTLLTVAQELGIELSDDFQLLAEGESFDLELFVQESSLDISDESAMNNQSQPDSGSEQNQQQFFVKDERTLIQNKKVTLDQMEPVVFSKTLEDLDKEALGITGLADSEILMTNLKSETPIFKTDSLSSIQKSYHTFSSNVSRVQVEALMQSVSAKAAIIMHDGNNELRLKLTPPELGQMKLSFISEDGIMTGKVVVETSEAKMFFEQNIDNLRESLANEGVRLADVSVELGNQSDFQSQEQQETSSPFQAVRTAKTASLEAPTQTNKLHDSMVDFIA
ncbi:MAG: flagellar hook-length control protein FliK [Brevinema sp.]